MKQIVIVSSHLQKIFKTDFLKNFAKLTEKHLLRSLFLISFKTTGFFQNETPTQVFSSEFCETFKNNIFTEHLRTTAFVFMEHIFNIKKSKFSRNQNQVNVKISSPSDSAEFVNKHCQKRFRIWSYSDPCSVRMGENKDTFCAVNFVKES